MYLQVAAKKKSQLKELLAEEVSVTHISLKKNRTVIQSIRGLSFGKGFFFLNLNPQSTMGMRYLLQIPAKHWTNMIIIEEEIDKGKAYIRYTI